MSGGITPQDAKINYGVYEQQVLEKLTPLVNEGIHEIYKNAYWYVNETQRAPSKEDVFDVFQQLLSEIKHWSEPITLAETEKVFGRLSWLREVLRQMVIQQASILLGVKDARRLAECQFTFQLPSNTEITKRLYAACGNALQGYVDLYDHTVKDKKTRARNAEEAMKIIAKQLKRTISTLVPIEQIVSNHLRRQDELHGEDEVDDGEEEDNDDDDEVDGEEEDRVDPETEEKINAVIAEMEAHNESLEEAVREEEQANNQEIQVDVSPAEAVTQQEEEEEQEHSKSEISISDLIY